jgi:hypothetical protein
MILLVLARISAADNGLDGAVWNLLRIRRKMGESVSGPEQAAAQKSKARKRRFRKT